MPERDPYFWLAYFAVLGVTLLLIWGLATVLSSIS